MTTIAVLGSEVERLKVKVARINTILAITGGVALVFGLTGAFGAVILNGATEKLAGLNSKLAATERTIAELDGQIGKRADAAVSAAVEKNHVGERVLDAEKNVSKLLRAGGMVDTVRAGVTTGNGYTLTATCPIGTVARGISLTLGGDCDHKCNSAEDGRPVLNYRLECTDVK